MYWPASTPEREGSVGGKAGVSQPQDWSRLLAFRSASNGLDKSRGSIERL
jgi:hypothetical protein